MFARFARKLFSWVIAVTLIAPTFITPFRAFAESSLIIPGGQYVYMWNTDTAITVTDDAANANPAAKDTLSVHVSSDADAAGIDVTLEETGDATSIFSGFIRCVEGPSNKDATPPEIQSVSGGNIHIAYADKTADATVHAALYTDGDPNYNLGDTVNVRLSDIRLNTNPETAESVNIQVTSTADTTGITLTLTEDGQNSSNFRGSVLISDQPSAGDPPAIEAQVGNNIAFVYNDNGINVDTNVTVVNRVADIVAEPAPGAVTEGAEITLSTATTGASIYYTLDGSQPSSSSTLYADDNKPVISSDTHIRAVAIDGVSMDSRIADLHYSVAGPDLMLLWSSNRARNDGQLEVGVQGFSHLGDMQNITAVVDGNINDENQHLELHDIRGDYFDPEHDIGRLMINVPGNIQLPYGKYSMTIMAGEDTVAPSSDTSDDFYILAGTDITPRVVASADYRNGAKITADVRTIDNEKLYSWGTGSNIKARINMQGPDAPQPFDIENVTVNGDKTLQFSIPTGMDEALYAEGYRHVEFIDKDSGYPLAWGDFPVGTTSISEVSCFEGKGVYIFGSYLNAYSLNNTYADLFVDGVKVDSTGYWRISDDCVYLDFKSDLLAPPAGKNYTIDFYCNGVNILDDRSVTFVPRLTSGNPVITGNNSGENIVINEEGSAGWTAGQDLTLVARDSRGYTKFTQSTSDGVTVNEGTIELTTKNPIDSDIYTLEVTAQGGQKLGYLEFYVSGGAPVLQGTITDPNNNPVSFGTVRLETQDKSWGDKYCVGRDGKFYIAAKTIYGGFGDYLLTAFPTSDSAYCRSASLPMNFDDAGFSGIPDAIQLQQPICAAQILDPDGNPLNSGFIEIRKYVDENNTFTVSKEPVQSGGSYVIPPLDGGSYEIIAHPSYGQDYVDSLHVDFEVVGNDLKIDGTVTTNIDLKLRTAQVEGAVTKSTDDSQANEYEYYISIYSPDGKAPLDKMSIIRNDGSYRIGGLESGNYIIRAMYNLNAGDTTLAASYAQSFTLDGNTNFVTCDFELTEPQIKGTIKEPDGDPFNKGYIEVLDSNRNGMGYKFDIAQNGYYAIGGLPDGTYYIQVNPWNMVNAGYPEFDSYDPYAFTIADGDCGTPVKDISLETRQPRIDRIDNIQIGSDSVYAHIVNASLLKEGESNLVECRILDDSDQAVYSGTAEFTFMDGFQDRGDLRIDLSQIKTLPTGRYTLEILKGGNPIDAIQSDKFFVTSGIFISPTVVPAEDFPGYVYSVGVNEFNGITEYPWIEGDTVHVRLNHDDNDPGLQVHMETTSVITSSNAPMSFQVPADAPKIEGRYNIEFYKMINGEEYVLANGDFDVGTTAVRKISAEDGGGRLIIDGDYLRSFSYGGAYAEVYADGVYLGKSANFSYEGDQWYLPFRMSAGVNYTVDLVVPGQDPVVEGQPVQIVPCLLAENPIVKLGTDNTIRIYSQGRWNSDDSLQVRMWDDMGGGFNVNLRNAAVSYDAAADDQVVSFSIPASRELEDMDGGTRQMYETVCFVEITNAETGEYLGYTRLYASEDPDNRILGGTVSSVGGDPVVGAAVSLNNEYGFGMQFTTGADGKYYFILKDMPDGDFRLRAQPPYGSTQAPAIGGIHLDASGCTGSLDLQLNTTQITGHLALPDNATLHSGSVNVFDNSWKYLFSVDVSPDGSFSIGGLAEDDYHLVGSGDGSTPYADSDAMTVTVGAAVSDVGTIKLKNPQLAVSAKDPLNKAIDFNVEIRSLDGNNDWRYDSRYIDGVVYIWNIPKGNYTIHAVNGTDEPYAWSYPANISVDEGGSCSPGSLQLELTEPVLMGNVVLPGGAVFKEGYVQVFGGEWDNLEYLGWTRINSEGNFFMGGLEDGAYYVRACINDNSPARQNYSASGLTRVELPTADPIDQHMATLTLNDKNPRYRNVRDSFLNDDRMRIRLLNASAVNDISKLSARITDGVGHVFLETANPDAFYMDWGSRDENMDEMDLEIRFDGGFRDLLNGAYKLELYYDGQLLDCDDPDNGSFSLYYGINTMPYVTLTGEASGAAVRLEMERFPWWEDNLLSVKLYDSQGIETAPPQYLVSGQGIDLTLPDNDGTLEEGRYLIKIFKGSDIVAMGGLVIGDPVVTGINNATEGDGSVQVQGKNLEFFNGNSKAFAKILKNGIPVYNAYNMNFDGDWLHLDFDCSDLPAGEYQLQLGYDNIPLDLPNEGRFQIVQRLYSDPSYLRAGYADGTLTLMPRPAISAPWTENDVLFIEVFGENTYCKIESGDIEKIILENGQKALRFAVPTGLNPGEYGINVNKAGDNGGIWIGSARFAVAESVQVSGKITEAGGTATAGIPYAGVDIYNDNNGYHFDADAQGNYVIYGVNPGNYKMRATAPIGGKYVGDREVEINVSWNPDEPIGQDLALLPAKMFSGTVSLPDGQVAPEGGYSMGMLVWTDGGTPDDGSDDVSFWNDRTKIPAGENSAAYKFLVSAAVDDYLIALWLQDNDTYIKENFYKQDGTAFCKADATTVSGAEDRTNLNIRLVAGKTISGTVNLPENTILPDEGLDLNVVAVMNNDPETVRDDYVDSTGVHFDKGQTSASYTIAVPTNPEGQGYVVFYELNQDYAFVRKGFAGNNATIQDESLAKQVDVSGGNVNGIDLTLINPQLSVSAKTPGGDSIGFFINIQPASGWFDYRFDVSSYKGISYVWGLPEGDYYVYAMTGEGEYAQSLPGLIHIDGNGTCTLNDELDLTLTDPKLAGHVKTPTGDPFAEGYVEIFSGSETALKYIVSIPINGQGDFYMGGLSNGDYYIRAGINDDSGFRQNYSSSCFTKVALGTDSAATLTLNEKSTRFRVQEDSLLGKDTMRVRLVNPEPITDNSLLKAEIVNGSGQTVQTIAGAERFRIDNGTKDDHNGEVDLEILFSGGLDLDPGQYTLKLYYNNAALMCDNAGGGAFSVFYGLNVDPFAMVPGEVEGNTVRLEANTKGRSCPWSAADAESLTVNFFYGWNDTKVAIEDLIVNDDGSLTITLPAPALAEENYRVEVSKNGALIAIGGFMVGTPKIDGLYKVFEGDDNIVLYGKNLEPLAGGYTTAQIFSGETLFAEAFGTQWSGDGLVLNFKDLALAPEDYTLKLQYKKGEQVLPGGGSFTVLPRLDADRTFLSLTQYQANKAITLTARGDRSAPWNAGEDIAVEIFANDFHYIIEPYEPTEPSGPSNVQVNERSITFNLPDGIGEGVCSMVVRKWIPNQPSPALALSEINIIGQVQISGTVTDTATGNPVPYAIVEAYDHINNRGMNITADKTGFYSIYGLPEGEYRMIAHSPRGGAYANTQEVVVNVDTDPIQQNFALTPGSVFSGTVSLPEGRVAPVGGYRVSVFAFSLMGTPDDKTDDTQFYNEVYIPYGSNSASYSLNVLPQVDDYVLDYWVNGDAPFITDSYYNSQGTAFSITSAETLNGASSRNGLNLAFEEGNVISGTIALPNGMTAPEGGISLQVAAIMDNDTETDLDDYVGSMNLYIPSGKTSVTYSLILPANPLGKGYMVSYSLNGDYSLERSGFYNADGTVYTPASADRVDISSNDQVVNLKISQPLAPVVMDAYIGGNGDTLELRMSKPLDEDALSDAGLTLTVNGVAYAVSDPSLSDKGDLLILKTNYVIFSDDSNIKLSYNTDAGTIKSFDGLDLAAFGDTEADNKSSREHPTVTGVTDGSLYNHDVSMTVTGPGFNLVLSDNENEAASNTDSLAYIFEEGKHHIIITAAGLKDRIEMTFTVDTTAPDITIADCADALNHVVTPVITFSSDCVEGTRSVTLNGVAYTSGTTITNPGEYTIIAKASDEAGNERTETKTFTIEWDESVPLITTNVAEGGFYESVDLNISLSIGSNQGKYDYTAHLTGPGSLDKTYHMSDNDLLPSLTDEGSYTLTIDVVNHSWKDFSGSVSFNFTIDSKSPAASIGNVVYGNLYNTTVTPAVTFTDTVASEAYLTAHATIILKKGDDKIADYVAGDEITEDGSYVLTAETVDEAGHVSNTATVSFTIDRTAPVITITECANALNKSVTPKIAFSDDCVKESKSVTLNGAAYTIGTAITAPGDYTVIAMASDAAGNTTTEQASFNITWDESLPVISTNIDNDAFYETVTPSINLTGGSNVNNYTFSAVLTKPDSSTVTFTENANAPVITAEGSYKLEITAVNPSWKHFTSTLTLNFTIDNKAPSIGITSVANNGLYSGSVKPVISFSDTVATPAQLAANATIELKKNGSVVDGYASGGTISNDGDECVYVLAVTTHDANNHTTQKAVSFKIDSKKPVIGITGCSSIENDPNGIIPAITFDSDCLDNTKTATLNGVSYNYAAPSAIKAPGIYTLIASARDAAGNIGSAAVTFEIKWDASAPAIATPGLASGMVYESVKPSVTLTGGTNVGNYTYSAKLTKPDGSTLVFTKNADAPTITAEGSYKLEITAVNPGYAEISSNKTINLTIDNNPPSAVITGVSNNGLYNRAVNPSIALTDNVASQALLWSNATVTLTKNGSAVASYKPGDVITADGTYVLSAQTKDSLNHVSNTASVTFNIDCTKPVINLTGVLNGYTYKDQDVTLTASANEGSLTATVNGTAADISSGSVTLTGDANAITQYHVVLTATDTAGNTATMEVSFTVDRLPVNIVVNGITEGQIVNYNPNITFTTYNGTDEQEGTTATIDKAAYNPNTVLTEGKHAFTAKIVLEGVSYSKTVNFTVDKTAPVISDIGTGKNGTWSTQAIYAKSGDVLGIRAKAAETNGVQEVHAVLLLDTVETKVPLTFNQTTGYYEGTYIVGGGDFASIPLSIYATDKAGNSGSNKTYANTINIDNTKPIVSRTSNPAVPDGKNGIFTAAGMNVVLTAGSGETITYTLNSETGSAVGTVTLTPRQGDNILVFKARDQAGNVGDEKVFVFKYDSLRPANVELDALNTPATGLVNAELLKINGTVPGEGTGAKVVLKRGSDTVAIADVKNDKTFEFSGVRLLEGDNSFTLIAVDYAGNTSIQATSLTRTLDTISPLLKIVKDGDVYTITSSEDIAGTITAKFNGADVDGSNINKVTARSFTIDSPEEIEGLNTLNVWGTDAAGNTGTGSYSSTYIPPNTAQTGLDVGDNTSIDIPGDAFKDDTIQMVVRTVDIKGEIDYKPISAPVQFDFSQNPEQPIVVRIQIGMGLTGVMLMHIDDNGNAGVPVPATMTTSGTFNIGAMGLDDPYYLSDTGELVFKTTNFSAYGAVADNTPPTIAISTTDLDINKSDYDAAGGISLAGSVTDASNAQITSVKINGVKMDLSGIAPADLDKTFDIPLAISDDGVYDVEIIATDSAGNVSDPKAVTINVDIHNPVLSATCGTALTNRNTVDITVNVSEPSDITLNGNRVTNDEGQFTITANLGEGVNTLNIAATDALGNTAAADAISVTCDTAPPEIEIIGANDGDIYGADVNITVNVTGEASKTVFLDGVPFAGGSCTGNGVHNLAVTASDAAGNTANENISFTIDTSVPVVTVTGAANNGLYTIDKTLGISASNADKLTITKSVNGGAAQNVAVPNGDLAYTLALQTANNQQDTYVIVVTASKTVGVQIRTASTTIRFIIDKKNPGLTATAPAQTENATVDIAGSVDELSDIYLNNALFISNQQAGSFTISGRPVALGDNTFTIKAIDRAGHETTKSITVKRVEPAPVNPGGGFPGGGGFPPPPPSGGVVSGSTISYKPTVTGNTATTGITGDELNEAIGNAKPDASGVKTVKLNISKAEDATSYVQEIPAETMRTGTGKQQYIIETEIASITVPGNMFSSWDTAGRETMGISIGLADRSGFSKELAAQIGNRPVVELKAMADGKPLSWSNPAVPVTISMDYTPTAEELKNPDHIVVLFIGSSGKAIEVPNGRYDPATRKVTFTTTHFSKYAVAYVNRTFEDISGAYAKDMIETLASKGFYNWVSGTKFNPDRSITRAEFIYLVVTALDLHGDFITNFSDVKPTDYCYNALGIAKKLGITSGTGNNKVGAEMSITRQDMSTILVKALKIAGKNYPDGNTADLNAFRDANKIAGYAKTSLATLVKAGIMVGSNKILDPNGTFTMQHAAVVIYKIYKK